jgi:uncharacterized cupin superfamily protein
MYIRKMTDETERAAFSALSRQDFIFGEKKVQGAKMGKFENALLVKDAARFKLYTDGKDLIEILSGEGHFKWKKGELPFTQGDCFEADGVGEYEINGSSEFLVIRK